MTRLLDHRGTRYVFAALGVAFTVAVLEPLRSHINATTIALTLLLVGYRFQPGD